MAKYKPKGEKLDKMTVEQFGEVYRGVLRGADNAPIPRTALKYVDALGRVCRLLKVDNVLALTPELVGTFKPKYLAEAAKAGRDIESAKTSCNSTLAMAAAPFAKRRLRQWKEAGYSLTNPFENLEKAKPKLKSYTTLPRTVMDAVWRDAALLRDGDPNAPEPKPMSKGGRLKKGAKPLPKEQRAKRHHSPDWRSPQPVAYAVLLLELGCGFRRNEADHAMKDWIRTDKQGRHTIEVRQTPYFMPKSKQSRIIPLEQSIYDALKPIIDSHVSPMLLPGPLPLKHKFGEEPKSVVYRLDKAHRILSEWLRLHGIVSRTPCHTLRKEFGSYVATSFNLFAAQKLLGHSSPDVTAQYYAGLVDLPQLSNAKIF